MTAWGRNRTFRPAPRLTFLPVREVRREIRNYKRFKALTAQWIALSI